MPAGSALSRPATTVLWLSIAETLSFLALLGAMTAGSEAGVSVIGATHGLLFLAYAIAVWVWRRDLGWTTGFAILAIVTGPIGAIIALERIRRDRRGHVPEPAPEPPTTARR